MPFCLRLITASPLPAMPHHRRAQGQAPCLPRYCGTGGIYEDTSLGHPAQALLAPSRQAKPRFAERAGQTLLAPGLSASVTSQLSLHPSINAPPRSPAAVSLELLRNVAHVLAFGAPRCSRLHLPTGNAWPCRWVPLGAAALRLSRGDTDGSPVVEVNGFEPMTSCLQSRRSPS